MYKKIIIVLIFCVLSIVFALYEWGVFCKISEEATKQRQFQNRAAKINLEDVCAYKNSEKLFVKASEITLNLLESQIKSITKLCKTSDIKIDDINQFELIISSDNEKNITDCLKILYLQLNGLVKFQSIKMKKGENEIKAKINCKIIYFDSGILSSNIKIYPQKISHSDVRLFRKKNMHQLLATINNSQAFIDDEWKKIGEYIDEDDIIIGVNQYTILVKNDNQVKTIHIGEKW